MAALFVAGFVGLFSETALNIALSQLTAIFAVSNTTVQWLATGYFLTLGILVPVTGVLMQRLTTRQLFLTSVSLSIFGTIIAALAPSFGILLAARVIQAAGLAIVLPLTQNVIFTIFTPDKRGGAMGVMGLVILAGPALGPTLAGLILDTLSWHWIFWFTLPFLLFSIALGYIHIPNLNELRKVRLDALSVCLSTIGFGGVVYGFSAAGDRGWGDGLVTGSIVVGLSGLLLFALRQTKMEMPMLNMKAFRSPLFVLGLIMNMITFLNMLSLLVVLPMFMQIALVVTAFATGLLLLPGSLLNCILSPVIGRMFDRYGPRAVIVPGTILIAVGYLLYATYGTETALWAVALTHVVMMLGVGLVIASVQTNTLNALPRRYYPDGIAITQTAQQVCGAIGIAVMVSLMTAKQNRYLEAVAPSIEEAAAAGSSLVFKIGLALAVVNVAISLFFRKARPVQA
ncbi:multidrug efflux MFS transporter [Cohnella fermenti]|uniref:Multidrug efflux MFS transporter n=2 Tax=Cohnella fermenti TaxID=2565925 RepID=A0A4S4C6J1_9BACL|nr:multidrug efflux MFS transporter [Cohnella fermenti]